MGSVLDFHTHGVVQMHCRQLQENALREATGVESAVSQLILMLPKDVQNMKVLVSCES